jgi:hypothetical protein
VKTLVLMLALAACTPSGKRGVESAKRESDTLWLLASDSARDAVHATDTETDLIRRYGAANVRRDSVNVGEGFYEPGAVIFPDDSLRRLEVIWQDTLKLRRPRIARIQEYVRTPRSRWVVFPGISLGTCLPEVERINGGSFMLFGFAFDGAGTVDNWGKGRLDALWKSDPGEKLVWVRFDPTIAGPLPRQISGDRLISSTLPAMRAVKPCIREIGVVPR